MAFNPFHTFRKNSKPILAVVTIFIMFIFVLSSGIGQGLDFFDWFARQLGGSDRRGPVLGSLDGTDYHQKDLTELRMKRAAANYFMFAAVASADQQIVKQISQDLSGNALKNQQVVGMLSQIIGLRNRAFGPGAQLMEQFQYQNQIQDPRLLGFLDNIARSINAKESQHELKDVRRMMRIIQNDARRSSQRGDNPLYFEEVQNSTEEDALQFAMYLRVADSLPIKYSDKDIQQLIDEETDGQMSRSDAAEIAQKTLSRYRGLSAEQVFQSVGNEFRIVLAMKVLRGSVYSGRFSVPAAMTPYEFFEYYKDRCTEDTFEVVDVATEPFLAQVKEEPTDKELRLLFDKYRTAPFDPGRETPGFQEPRKVKIEFVAVDGSQPVYKQAIPSIQAASAIGGGFNPTYLGVGPLPTALAVLGPELAEPLAIKDEMQRKLNLYKNSRFTVFDRNEDPLFRRFPQPMDVNVYQPLPAAALTAQLAVMSQPMANIASAVGAYSNLVNLLETRDRVKLGMQIVLAPYNPVYPLTAAGPALANLPADPTNAIAAETAVALAAKRPEAIAEKDLESLEKKLKDLRAKIKPDEEKSDELTKKKEPMKYDAKKIQEANAEARQLVDNWIRSHPQALTGTSTALRDKYRIVEDESLKDVFAELKKARDPVRDVEERFFADASKVPLEVTLYDPKVMTIGRDYSKPVYVAWKVEDRAAKTYSRFDDKDFPAELKNEVVKAWKMEKARVLAQEAAETLAVRLRGLGDKELRQADNPAAFNKGLTDLTDAGKYKVLDPVVLAMLKKQPPLTMQPRDSEPWLYSQTPIDSAQFSYPPRNMADALLDVRNKPLGEVILVPNVPKTHFYVSVLSNKKVPNIEEFYNSVFRNTNMPAQIQMQADSLYSRHALREVFRDFARDLNERLKAETKFKETDELKKTGERQSPQPFE